PSPLPDTWERLTLCSRAILRTSGDERACSSSSCFGAADGAGWAGASALGAGGVGAGATFFSAAGAAALGVPSPSLVIVPTTVFTWTVVPSATLMSWSTPDAGAGISASTLSVEISKSGSSRWTLSPCFFSHLVIVPSTMDSPIWGMTISVGIVSFHVPYAAIWGCAIHHYIEIEPLISVLVTMPMLVLFARRRRRNSKGFFPILLNCQRELIEAGEKRSHFPDILLT